jgi:4-hydroxy-2-oxoheptanedioate aldolase
MPNKLKTAWQSGKAVVNGWLAIPNAFSAEMYSRSGWDSVTVDMQHGVQDYLSCVACFQGMQGSGAVPMVRVPWNEPGIIGKVLDAGSYGEAGGYQKTANDEILVIPMIETKTAIGNIDAILDVPGIDGIYVGPSDLSFSYGKEPKLDVEDPEILAIYDKLIAATGKRNIAAGIHCGTAAYAKRAIKMGFKLVTISNEVGLMVNAAKAAIAEAKS